MSLRTVTKLSMFTANLLNSTLILTMTHLKTHKESHWQTTPNSLSCHSTMQLSIRLRHYKTRWASIQMPTMTSILMWQTLLSKNRWIAWCILVFCTPISNSIRCDHSNSSLKKVKMSTVQAWCNRSNFKAVTRLSLSIWGIMPNMSLSYAQQATTLWSLSAKWAKTYFQVQKKALTIIRRSFT